MGYSLGVDLGATTCVARGEARSVEVCALGDLTAAMPAVALDRGRRHAARRRGGADRARYEHALVARHVVAHLDDGQPIVLDGRPHDPMRLTQAVLETAIDRGAASPASAPRRRGHLSAVSRRRAPSLLGGGPGRSGRGAADPAPRGGRGPAGAPTSTSPWERRWRSSTWVAGASRSRSCAARRRLRHGGRPGRAGRARRGGPRRGRLFPRRGGLGDVLSAVPRRHRGHGRAPSAAGLVPRGQGAAVVQPDTAVEVALPHCDLGADPPRRPGERHPSV